MKTKDKEKILWCRHFTLKGATIRLIVDILIEMVKTEDIVMIYSAIKNYQDRIWYLAKISFNYESETFFKRWESVASRTALIKANKKGNILDRRKIVPDN